MLLDSSVKRAGRACYARGRALSCAQGRLVDRVRPPIARVARKSRFIAHLDRALSRHKPYVATWEIPYFGILYHDREFSVVTESFEKSVAQADKACRERPAPCRVRKPGLWVATGKHLVTTPPLEFLLRHKVLCHNRNVPTLGKLCHDIRRPLS